MPNTLREAYEAGNDAFKAGLGLDSNKYPADSREFIAFRQGFETAQWFEKFMADEDDAWVKELDERPKQEIALWELDDPKFQHDCNRCVFLGCSMACFSTTRKNTEIDLYYCPGPDPETNKTSDGSIIARFGNDGPDYWSHDLCSALRIIGSNHDFVSRAIARAARKGVLTGAHLLNAVRMWDD